MAQKGSTLSLYPSSVTCYNNNNINNNNNGNATNMNNVIMSNTSSHLPPSSSEEDIEDDYDDDDDKDHPSKNNDGSAGRSGSKSRRELPTGAVATLKAWLLAPEHFTHPYPTPQDQIILMKKTGIDKKQLKNWFTNARRRIWKPMLKKQLEAGKLAAATAVASGTVITNHGEGEGGGGMSADLTRMHHQHTQYSQEPRQEMYSNFQLAQSQQQHQKEQQQSQIMESSYDQQQQYKQQQAQFLQSIGELHQQPVYDQYGNQMYDTSSYEPPYSSEYDTTTSHNNHHHQYPTTVTSTTTTTDNQFPLSNSIGSLPPMPVGVGSMSSFGANHNMVKTDSHAVLMELFARDQDLVRQAASNKGVVSLGNTNFAAQHPQQPSKTNNDNGNNNNMGDRDEDGISTVTSPSGNVRWAPGSSGGGGGGPILQKQHSVTFEGISSLSSWPHFSSVSSLNNLGGLQGVKSIANLSAADLSSQGNLNKMGNLAHVKSYENMGRIDSFAFLEVFFDDKSGLNGSSHSNLSQRGIKREREDDDAIGLSLDGDDGTSPGQFISNKVSVDQPNPSEAPCSDERKDNNNFYEENNDGTIMDSGTLKRAYDDALAARGLIAVRRSCEKLTDLALPAKMQRTLSQEYIRQHNQGHQMDDFFSANNSAYAPNSIRNNNHNNNVYGCDYDGGGGGGGGGDEGSMLDQNTNINNTSSVEVPSSTTCTLCMSVNVDTQLRPCGHMFHGYCLKPSLQIHLGPPKCPICYTTMQSAILAVPTASTECGGSAVTTG